MEISAQGIAEAVEAAIPHLACDLSPDVACAFARARADESSALATNALRCLCENADVAREQRLPICQDTGTVWVCVEAGPDVCIAGDAFSFVDAAVARAYTENRLRASVVQDALCDRGNSGDNTPAFCEIRCVEEPGARLHVMLKGGGSDNASRVCMLAPGAGRAGVREEVLRCVREKGANACPPLTIGVGIGGTFDKVAGLAKHALMRPVGKPAACEDVRLFEEELLAAVNGTGVGAGGMGGRHTAIAVHVETSPCHIAALPVAINMGCSALRRTTFDYVNGVWRERAFLGEDGERAAARGEANSTGAANVSAPGVSGAPMTGVSGAPVSDAPASDVAPVRRLRLPEDAAQFADLVAGDLCELDGVLYTLRDAGHMRLLAETEARGTAGENPLPYGLAGQTIFYAGPTPPKAGKPFGAIGPTTASRMDFAAPTLYRAGIKATIGKGTRSAEVRRACRETGSVYFAAIGGIAALLAQCVDSAEVVAYGDLGTEALRRIEVHGFPVVVAIDSHGNTLEDALATSAPCEVGTCEANTEFGEEQSANQFCGELPSGKPSMAQPGILVTFEGGEGAGKSTHIRFLTEVLEQCGREVVTLREPGGTSVGESLRGIVLDPLHSEISPETELLLYETARAQIVAERIEPALRRGAVVLCDRFTDSTIAYQVYGRGLSREFVEQANDFATHGIRPDRTILLRTASGAEIGLERATRKEAADRIEAAGVDFHARVNAAFADLAQAQPDRIRAITSMGEKAETFAAVLRALEDLFPDIPGFVSMVPESLANPPEKTLANPPEKMPAKAPETEHSDASEPNGLPGECEWPGEPDSGDTWEAR